jgi:1-acyl-sn-glycerol-3-phosphate acyltransferase
MSQRSLAKRLWYSYLHVMCRLLGAALAQVRCVGRHYIPPEGGALILSNHQSHLDPLLIGLAADRRLNFLARETLFTFLPFRWLIQSLNAIPIDREGVGLSGLKETMRRVRDGEIVLIFPEGTRTPDGEVAILKAGFCALARRVRAPLVPAAIDGAFDAWPRTRRFPRRACIHVVFGPALLPDEIAQLDDNALVARVEDLIRACHHRARNDRLRAVGIR